MLCREIRISRTESPGEGIVDALHMDGVALEQNFDFVCFPPKPSTDSSGSALSSLGQSSALSSPTHSSSGLTTTSTSRSLHPSMKPGQLPESSEMTPPGSATGSPALSPRPRSSGSPRVRLSTSLHTVHGVSATNCPSQVTKTSSDPALSKPYLTNSPTFDEPQVLLESRLALEKMTNFSLGEDLENILTVSFSRLSSSTSTLNSIQKLRMCFASPDAQVSLSAVAVAGLALDNKEGEKEIVALLEDGDTWVVAHTCQSLINASETIADNNEEKLAKELLSLPSEIWSEVAQHFVVLPVDVEERSSILKFLGNMLHHRGIVSNFLKSNALGTLCVRILGQDWQGRFSSSASERHALISLLNTVISYSKSDDWKRICEDVCVFESLSAFFATTTSDEHAILVLQIVHIMCQDIQFVHYFAGKDISFTQALVAALNEKTAPGVRYRLARVCGALMQDYGGLKNLTSGGVFKFFAQCLNTASDDELLIAVLTALGNLALSDDLPSNHAALITESKILNILQDMLTGAETSLEVRHLCAVAVSNLMTLEYLQTPFVQSGGIKVIVDIATKANPPADDAEADLFQRCLSTLFHLSLYHDILRIAIVQSYSMKVLASVVSNANTPFNNASSSYIDSMDKARSATFRTLVNLSMVEATEAEFAKQGVIDALLKILKSTSSSPKEDDQKGSAICIFENIAPSASFQEYLLANGGLEPILALLRHRSAFIQQRAARLLARISTRPDTRRHLQRAGVEKALQAAKENASVEVQSAIEAAIVNIAAPLEDPRRSISPIHSDDEEHQEFLIGYLASEYDLDDDGSILSLERYIQDTAPQTPVLGFSRPKVPRSDSNVSSSSSKSTNLPRKPSNSSDISAPGGGNVSTSPLVSPTHTPGRSFPQSNVSPTSSTGIPITSNPNNTATSTTGSQPTSPRSANRISPRPALPPKPSTKSPRTTAAATTSDLPPKPTLITSDSADSSLDTPPLMPKSSGSRRKVAPIAPPRSKVSADVIAATEDAIGNTGHLSTANSSTNSLDIPTTDDAEDESADESTASLESRESVSAERLNHNDEGSHDSRRPKKKKKKGLFSSIKNLFSPDSRGSDKTSNGAASETSLDPDDDATIPKCRALLYDYYHHWCGGCRRTDGVCIQTTSNLQRLRMNLIKTQEPKSFAPTASRRTLARSTSDPMPSLSGNSMGLTSASLVSMGEIDDLASPRASIYGYNFNRDTESVDGSVDEDMLLRSSAASFRSHSSSNSSLTVETNSRSFSTGASATKFSSGPLPPLSTTSVSSSSLGSSAPRISPMAPLIVPMHTMHSSGSKKTLPLDIDPESVRKAKVQVKRTYVIQELLNTEAAYMQNLQIMIKKFQAPLLASLATPKPLLSEADIKTIFGSIELIYNVNMVLLELLSAKMRNWTSRQTIGDVFVYMADWFRVYTDYINNYDQSQSTLLRCKEESPRFAQFLYERSMEPICALRGLESFLVAPIQRLPRYGLLLRELIKVTDESHPDHADLNLAVSRIDEITHYLNEKRKEFDARLKMLTLAHSLQRTKTRTCIVLPHRENLLDFAVTYNIRSSGKAGPGRLYLLNDSLLVTRHVGKARQKVVRLLPIADVAASLPTGNVNVAHPELSLIQVSEHDIISVVFDNLDNRDTLYDAYMRLHTSSAAAPSEE